MAGMRENIRVGMDRPSKTKKAVSSKLVRRVRLLQTSSDNSSTPVPFIVGPDERFLVVRGAGSGGGVFPNATDGAGGAGGYFKSWVPVLPGETLRLVTGLGIDTLVTRADGTVIAIARAGGAGNNSVNGKGGTAQGQIAIPGQDGSFVDLGGGTKLCDGGALLAESNISPVYSMRTNPDNLRVYGKGASSTAKATGYGSGGGKLNGVMRPPSGGVLILELYTGDPR